MTKTGAATRPTLDLEPETFAEVFQKYKTPILVGLTVVLAGTGGLWYSRLSAAKREARAAEAFAAGEGTFVAGNAQLAQPELEKAAERYRGTAAGTQASMLLGQILFDQGKHAEGLAALEKARGSAPKGLQAGLEALVGAGSEAAAKPKEAAAAFERAAAASEFQDDREMYRMDAARNLAVGGDVAAARAIYEAVSKRDDSPYSGEAKVRLGELLAKG